MLDAGVCTRRTRPRASEPLDRSRVPDESALETAQLHLARHAQRPHRRGGTRWLSCCALNGCLLLALGAHPFVSANEAVLPERRAARLEAGMTDSVTRISADAGRRAAAANRGIIRHLDARVATILGGAAPWSFVSAALRVD